MMGHLPSGKLAVCYGKWQSMVDLPIKMVIFHNYVSLPEGMWCYFLIVIIEESEAWKSLVDDIHYAFSHHFDYIEHLYSDSPILEWVWKSPPVTPKMLRYLVQWFADVARRCVSWVSCHNLPHITQHFLRFTGWWFGCHFWHFPINIGLPIIPIDELIFFRGVAQPPTSLDYVLVRLHKPHGKSENIIRSHQELLARADGERGGEIHRKNIRRLKSGVLGKSSINGVSMGEKHL